MSYNIQIDPLPHDVTGFCSPGRVQCATNGQCIPVSYMCDFIPHCDDKSDEMHCGTYKIVWEMCHWFYR